MYNKTEFIVHYKSADLTVGTIYLICFAFGLPSNILALCFFVKQRLRSSELNNHLYILTTVNDAFISLLTLNYGMTMVRYRDVWLPDFCPTQHIFFKMSQRISVLLVASLSLSRTYILLFPLRKVSQRLVLSLIAVVVVSMACFFAIPPFVKLVQITYHWEDGYCWVEAIPGKNMTKVWDEIDNTLDTIFLACPVLPVTVSCIIASYKILSSRKDKPGVWTDQTCQAKSGSCEEEKKPDHIDHYIGYSPLHRLQHSTLRELHPVSYNDLSLQVPRTFLQLSCHVLLRLEFHSSSQHKSERKC